MNGSVSKYRTDSGVMWRCRWWLPKAADGSRSQRSKSGFRTRAEAQAFLRDVLSQQDRGRVAPSSRDVPTVAEAARAWLDERSADVRATTLDNWRVNLDVHVVPRLGGLRLSEVKPETVAGLYREVGQHGKAVRLGKGDDGKARVCRTAGVTCRALGCSPDRHDGLSEKSVSHVHNALRAMLAQAVEDGVIASNPADEKRARRAMPERVSDEHRVSESDYWRDHEARAFLAHRREAGDALVTVWELALATGLRRAELAGLTWANVDLDRVDKDGNPDPVVRVRRSTTAVRGKAVTTEGRGRKAGKTRAAHRDVPLGPSTVALLRAHRTAQAAARLAAAPGEWVESGHVFTGPTGEPINPNSLSRRWAASVRAAGVRPVTLHGTRHFAISAWLSDGVPVVKVSEYAGHADPGVTWRVYAHAISDDNSRARLSVERTLYGTA